MGRGRGMEKKNTGGIIGRGYTTHPSSATPTPRQAAPLTKETCSLPAAARAHASRRRDASRRSAYDSRLGLSLSFSFRLDGVLPRPGRSSGLYFASGGFCGLPGKGQPPCMYSNLIPFGFTACCHVELLGHGELPERRPDEL